MDIVFSIVIEPPIFPEDVWVRDLPTSKFEIYVCLPCPLSMGSNVTFKWYKNGINITEASDSSGNLDYTTQEDESTVGIYQCFAENDVGCDYAIIRLLEIGKTSISSFCMIRL